MLLLLVLLFNGLDAVAVAAAGAGADAGGLRRTVSGGGVTRSPAMNRIC